MSAARDGRTRSGGRRALVAAGLLAAAGLIVASAGVGAEPGVSKARPEADRFDVVVIDAGHGGEDEGARAAGRKLLEKDLVLDVAQRLARRLREAGLRVVMTRTEDRFVPLEERTSIANDARGDLFLSIHANSAPVRSARGTETYFASLEASDDAARRSAQRENQAFGEVPASALVLDDPLAAIFGDMIAGENHQASNEFARLANAELNAMDRMASRGVKQAPFVVLMGVQMPASLVELGFLSNAREAATLSRSARREALAGALARAVLRFGERYDARRGVDRSRTQSRGGKG